MTLTLSDTQGGTYLVNNKVPFFGWAVAPNWCNESYAFSADGCPLWRNGGEWPH